MNDTLLPPRRTSNGEDSLIPLINIVFLLLIFFMIAGHITSVPNDSIEPPISSSEAAVEEPPLLISMDTQGGLALNGAAVTLEAISEAVQRRQSSTGTQSVAVKADKAATAAELDALFDALRKAGVSTITLFSKSGAQE